MTNEQAELAEQRPSVKRFAEAYLIMAKDAKYRPEAPSDGFGNIQLSPDELKDPDRLRDEAAAYALKFKKEDDATIFRIGCSNFSTNRPFVFAIETARLLASGNGGNSTALRLLKMAVKEIEAVKD